MMKKEASKPGIFLVLLILLNGCAPDDQWIRFDSPESTGFITDSLINIEKHYEKMIMRGKIPGAAALVAKDGKIIYEMTTGYSDSGTEEPVEINDIFRLASMSKPVTSVAVMQLYEQGKLKLDDPVSKYIPSFADPRVIDNIDLSDTTCTSEPAGEEVTIHHLLTHTSGIAYGDFNPVLAAVYAKAGVLDFANGDDLTVETAMNALGALPLYHSPGDKFTYGLNTDVLGRIVEIVSGMTLGEYVNANITGPLKMDDTRYFFNSDISDRLVTAYIYSYGDSALVNMKGNSDVDPSYPVEGAKKYFSGGSGMSGTIRDYFVFAQAILNGGIYNGVRILEPETVDLMCSDHLGDIAWSDISTFGYGFSIDRRRNDDDTPGDIIRLGWAGAYNTWFSINPTDNIIAISMSQVFFNPFEDEVNNGFIQAVNSAYAGSRK